MIFSALFLDVFASSHAETLRVALEVSEQELPEGLARGHEFSPVPYSSLSSPSVSLCRLALSRFALDWLPRASGRKEKFREPLGCDRARFFENMPIHFEREGDARVTKLFGDEPCRHALAEGQDGKGVPQIRKAECPGCPRDRS